MGLPKRLAAADEGSAQWPWPEQAVAPQYGWLQSSPRRYGLGQRQPFSVHTPRHVDGQERWSQARPCQPSKQEQFTGAPPATMISPCTHPPGSMGRLQSGPDHIAEQRHTPGDTHWPWPLHSSGQIASSQSSPDQPSKHVHAGVPAAVRLHAPCRLQLSGQRGSAQSWPPHPSEHSHVDGATQAPCPEQLVSQMGTEQSAADQPSEQRQAPGFLHTPCLEQSFRQTGCEQSAPAQPALQLHSPGTRHWPRPWHSFGQSGPRSHASPA
jgi:hypothetical protein